MDASRAVMASMVVTVGSTVTYNLAPTSMGGKGRLPSPRLLIGTGLTFTGLSFLADLAPAVAKPLAATIAVTALTFYGVPIADTYFNPSKKGKTA